MILKHILSTIKGSSKKAKTAFVGSVVSVAALSGVVFAGYSPNRAVLDWNKPSDRKGSLDGPRINTFINTPYYGDERAFFDARLQENTTTSAYKDVLQGVTKGSKKVVLRTYIHNGANQDLNKNGTSIAKDAKVRIELPTDASQVLRAKSIVSISNPAPGYPAVVNDTTELVDARGFSINLVSGSAKIYSAGAVNGKTLGDNIVSNDPVNGGVKIGYDSLNGELPGCFDYQTFVEITVEIKAADSKVSKTVKKAGDTSYGETTTVAPGDKVQWLLKYENTGDSKQDNVRMFDALPDHLSVDDKSVRWIYKGTSGTDQDITLSNQSIFTKQVDFGSWHPKTWFYVRFDTTAKDDFAGCEITLTNQVRENSKQLPVELRDNAQVIIKKKDCVPPPESFSCDALDVQKLSRTSFRFSGSASVKNVTITGYIFKVNGAVAQDSASSIYNFSNQTPGDYKVELIVKTNKGNTAPSEVCTKTVTVERKPDVPVYSCDLLTLEKLGDRKVRLNAYASASGGATIERYIYNFGDGSEKLTTDKTTVEHTYSKDGFFVSTLQVVVKVNGELVTVDSNKCSAPVKFVPEVCEDNPKTPEDECYPCVDNPNTNVNECNPTTPPTKPPVTSLPNTGPGDIVAIFLSVTTAGTLLYAAVVRKLGSIL